MPPSHRCPQPLAYRVFPGERGSLLLLHGMAGSHAYFARPLQGVGGVRLLLPDLLGHGDSHKPDGGYTLREHLDPLLDLAAREGFPRPLVLGGHSMGAALAVALADALPEGAVAGLFLLNLPWFSSAMELHRVLVEGSPAYREACRGIEVRREEDLLEVGPAALRSAGNALPAGLRDGRSGPTEAALRGTARHLLFDFRLASCEGALRRLPALAVLGAGDPVAPPRLALPHLAKFPRTEALVVEGAGHHLLHTHGDQVRAALAAFLSGSVPG